MKKLVQEKLHIIDEIMADLFVYQNQKVIKEEHQRLFDVSNVNIGLIGAYTDLFRNVKYAWLKTQKYKCYFEIFYSEKIDKIEALNHHIHAYLEDVTTLQNKITTLLGSLKNDSKKIASNKKEADIFFKNFVDRTVDIFAGVSNPRGEHRHKGMRFIDGYLLVAENEQAFLDFISDPLVDEMLNQDYKPELIEKHTAQREMKFEKARTRWIAMAENNEQQINGYLGMLFKALQPNLYQVLNIRPIYSVISGNKTDL